MVEIEFFCVTLLIQMSKFFIFFSPKFLFALSCYKFRLLMSILKMFKESEVNQSTQ